ncbi:hypothetical protein [Shewanella gaetbuli]
MSKFFNNGRWQLPVTLESIARDFPKAYKVLVNMEPALWSVVLKLLNGESTCPAGYAIADNEYIKEDSIINILRTKHYIDITSCPVDGRKCKHYMKPEHIEEFLHDTESMLKRVAKEVNSAQERKLKSDLRRALKLKGREWIEAELKGYHLKNAANDDYF